MQRCKIDVQCVRRSVLLTLTFMMGFHCATRADRRPVRIGIDQTKQKYRNYNYKSVHCCYVAPKARLVASGSGEILLLDTRSTFIFIHRTVIHLFVDGERL